MLHGFLVPICRVAKRGSRTSGGGIAGRGRRRSARREGKHPYSGARVVRQYRLTGNVTVRGVRLRVIAIKIRRPVNGATLRLGRWKFLSAVESCSLAHCRIR